MPGRNHLAEASSPYLLQHAANPVHWHEWGDAAFAEAVERDVPMLLSVGYSACHWCHVMAHESFEDPATADLMNQWFVSVKVDREERPDVDRVYMDAVQAMTGRGGWPMTVFLTPDGQPFFAGTYFPKVDRPGHPSFTRVLTALHEAWADRRTDLIGQAHRLTAALAAPTPDSAGPLDRAALVSAYTAVASSFDPVHGGFGGAPKFPQAPTLEFLLRVRTEPWAPRAGAMLATTLDAMAGGGIHDHLGGGFARYSVDTHWAVPHFEKMLSDNAQLLRLYALAAQATGESRFAAVARSTARYLLTDLLLPEGGFAAGEDADSEGEEGTFYVFTPDQVLGAAGTHAAAAAEVLGVTPGGNFEGLVVLQRGEVVAAADRWNLAPEALQSAVTATLERLHAIRSGRVRPMRDDKVIAAWNGLAIRALADAAVAIGEPAYLEAAGNAARFVLTAMRRDDGRLHRSWRAGRLGPTGFCDDYAAMALGCFALYQATGGEHWFATGRDLTGDMVDLFADPAGDGFFATGRDAERLIARPKNVFDLPTPSDNSLAAEAMLHMAAFTGESEWWDRIDAVLRLGSGIAAAHPGGAGHLLAVASVILGPPLEVALVGPDRKALLEVLTAEYQPRIFLAHGDGVAASVVPLLAARSAPSTGAAAFVCRGFVCDLPVTTPAALLQALHEA